MIDRESSAYSSKEDKIIQKYINREGKWLRKEVIWKFSPLLAGEGRKGTGQGKHISWKSVLRIQLLKSRCRTISTTISTIQYLLLYNLLQQWLNFPDGVMTKADCDINLGLGILQDWDSRMTKVDRSSGHQWENSSSDYEAQTWKKGSNDWRRMINWEENWSRYRRKNGIKARRTDQKGDQRILVFKVTRVRKSQHIVNGNRWIKWKRNHKRLKSRNWGFGIG